MMKNWLFVFLLLLSGCGLHLKGNDPALQMKVSKPIFVLIDYGSVSADFRQEFQQTLDESHYIIVSKKEEANIQVFFFAESCKRRSLSVSRSGVPVEYRLSCKLSFHIQKNDVVKRKEIIESRDFQSNDSQLLAFDSQQMRLKQQIMQVNAQRVMRQLQVLR